MDLWTTLVRVKVHKFVEIDSDHLPRLANKDDQ